MKNLLKKRAARSLAVRRMFNSKAGMSLVEVMVVIAIILTLMSLLAFGVMSQFAKSQVETSKLSIGKVAQDVVLYTLSHKKPPSTSEGLAKVYEGLDMPTDSWGNELLYVMPGPDGREFDIISLGADGAQGGSATDADIKYSDL